MPVGLLGSDEPETDRLHPVEHRLVPAPPVRAPVFSVPVEDVPVAGDNNSVAFLAANERRQVGDDPVGRGVGVDPPTVVG